MEFDPNDPSTWDERSKDNYDKEGNLKEVLMLSPTSYPEKRFTKEGEVYYYTRRNEDDVVEPITNEGWSLKDLAYPLNVPFGGKRQNNLGDYTFATWALNQAPSQLAPIGGAIKGLKSIGNQKRISPHGFYREGSVDLKTNTTNNKEQIMNEVFQIKDFTSGSIKKGGLFDPNAYGSLGPMYTAPNQDYLFNIEDYIGPLNPDSKEAARVFNDLTAKKSGYQSMAAFKRQVLNRWPQKNQEQLFRELWHNRKYEGYIEHLTAKGSHMNWYWDMKGLDRHAVENVRILYNDNLKNLKDTVEKIVYGSPGNLGLGWQSPNLKDRIIVSFEDPMRKTKKLYSRQNPGDIILKRAGNDKIIGNLGQYLDLLYPQDPILKDVFNKGVEKLDMTPADFRKMILTERINIILNNTNTLPANPTARKRWIKQNTDDDMAVLVQKYPFLSMPKAIKKQIDEDPGISTEGLDKRSETSRGPFKNVTKTEQFNPRQILMDIFDD